MSLDSPDGEDVWYNSLHGDAREVSRALTAGAPVDHLGVRGWTPLFAAAARGHREVVEVLLRREGMSLTASSERGRRRQGRCRLLAWRQAERLERLVRGRLRRQPRPKEKASRHARRPQSEGYMVVSERDTRRDMNHTIRLR